MPVGLWHGLMSVANFTRIHPEKSLPDPPINEMFVGCNIRHWLTNQKSQEQRGFRHIENQLC